MNGENKRLLYWTVVLTQIICVPTGFIAFINNTVSIWFLETIEGIQPLH